MKLGQYNGPGETYHQRYGLLKPGEVYQLDDDWNFERETLFEEVLDMRTEKKQHSRSEKGRATEISR